MLDVVNLRHDYGTEAVLRDVSIAVAAGEVALLTGPNGAGKSTLLRCILGLDRYDGSITWDGRPVDVSDRSVATVFDDAPFHGRLTGRQNLRVFYPEVDPARSPYVDGSMLSKRVSACSHGQRMRLALAGALGSSAPLLLLDEPTGGLDHAAMAQLRDDLGAGGRSRTVVMACHDVDFFADVADSIHRLEDGRLTTLTQPAPPDRNDVVHLRHEDRPPVAG